MLTVLKTIGIILLVLIGIVVVFVICFLGKTLFSAFSFMVRYILDSVGGLITVILGIIFLLIIIAAVF